MPTMAISIAAMENRRERSVMDRLSMGSVYRVSGRSGRLRCTVPVLSHCGWDESVPRAGRVARRRRQPLASSLAAVGGVCLAQCLCLPLLIGVDGGGGGLQELNACPTTEEREHQGGDQGSHRVRLN